MIDIRLASKSTRWVIERKFSAALERQKVYPGLDGGFVVCGISTSRMTKRTFCDLITLIYAFGDEHGVKWSEPKKDADELWRAA